MKYLRHIFIISVFFLIGVESIISQSFQDVSDILPFPISTEGYLGNGVSVADLNGDLLDDILVSTKNIPPFILINTGDSFTAIVHNIDNDGDIKMISAVDYDNDGDKDIFMSKYLGINTLWRNDGDWNFTDVTIEAGLGNEIGEYFSHCWVDSNKDGFLDLYVCNYEYFGESPASNSFFLGGPDGVFTNASATTPASDGSNFTLQAVFFDADMDGWQDLFVANDRLISDNHLYSNNEGVYEDISAWSGLDTNIFSMCAGPEDFDHDGDFDLYVSNNPTGNLLHRNIGNNQFEEVADELEAEVGDMSWSAVWLDFDNDGWRDLFVAIQPFWNQPGQNRLLKNEGGSFVNWTAAGGIWGQDGASYGAATGDFNNDGHEDLVVEFQPPNTMKILQNYGLGGEWIKVALTGTVSNRDAVGSLISVYAEDQMYIREVRIGENYLGQNSLTKTFGLGEICNVDSLVINWPSGHIDRFYDLVCGNTYQITEGNSLVAELTLSGEVTLCQGDSIWLSTSDNFDSYAWSNESDSTSILITEQGSYFTTVENEFGFVAISDTLNVFYAEPPQIDMDLLSPLCHGDENGAIIIADTLSLLTEIWINEDSTSVLEDLPAGEYPVQMIDQHGCLWLDTIELVEPEILSVAYTTEGINNDGTGYCQLMIDGGTPPYDISWSNGASGAYVEFNEVGNYTVSVEDLHGCGWYSGFNITSVDDLAIMTGKLYPNPVCNDLFISDLPENLESVTLFAAHGKVFESWILSGVPSTHIDLSHIPNGIYTVQLKLESGHVYFHTLLKI